MNNLKIMACVLALLPAVSFGQESGFQISGTAPKVFNGKKVYLDYTKDGFPASDSVAIADGKFSFTGAVEEPTYSRMVFDPDGKGKMLAQNIGDRLYFYLGNEHYTIGIRDSLRTASIKGSPLHNAYVAYLNEIGGGFMDIIDAGNKAFAAVDKDAPDAEAQYKAIHEKFEAKFEDRRVKELAFAKNNPNSIFAVDALIDAANKRKLSEIEPVFRKLSKEVRQLSTARQLEARFLAEKSVKIGNKAPDFSQPDIRGKMVKVSDFKGQYVLIDFWASWCSPCRAENPNLLKAYNKYKSKGLEVLAVSLDDTKGRSAWLKAIKDDGLPWIHVADLKGWSNEAAVLYGVRAVPQNYLVDPQGNIVALNLRGETLHQELARIFGN
ncbi:AhpC/TSA family protein [Sphingobacterium sp. N143]|uniref:TlpA disulfide reductase family protein n=1 Tax=Sphingobacterium sp. N143 TaxID=2746727 RepID=UPI0025763F25|nr:TlpA disulfide reductase family protein [Sphingobacterium sp. N143]MDM1296338.1 AhpC/TSA family protein [Sphingobacterium sp. N143]